MSRHPIVVLAAGVMAVGCTAVGGAPAQRAVHPCHRIPTMSGAPSLTVPLATLDLQDTTSASVEGTVYDIEGSPLDGTAMVELATPGSGRGLGAISDSAGSFAFEAVPPGEYELRVGGVGHLAQNHELDLLPGGADTLCLILRASPIAPASRSIRGIGANPVAAQVVPADSSYYDFWIGEWHQVVDGQIAPEPRFIVEEGIYPSALEERWEMEGYRAKAWRGWDASEATWTFVWISEQGHFQVWNERKVGGHWYMFKTFVIDGEPVLSRQAFIPQPDGSVIRTSEHSLDGGETWTLRFRETYVQVPEQRGR